MDTLLIVIVAFVIVLAILVLVRAKTDSKFEVKNTDIILALVPIALFLFLTG